MAAEKLILIADDFGKYRSMIDSGTDILMYSELKDISEFLMDDTADLIMIDAGSTDTVRAEICSFIKAMNDTGSIPVIVITSENEADIISEYFSAGCCDVISKSVSEQELSCRIRHHIDTGHKIERLRSDNNELNLFFAAVAHDLKSPVNSLIMLTDILKEEAVGLNDGVVKETSEILSNKAAKVSAMIDSLMNFSKICNLEPELEEINIELLFEDIFNDLHLLEPNRDIMLKTDTIPVICGDDVLIEMLIENLLSNAFKFTASREKAIIEVRYECDRQYHIVSVKDNGIGFDMADSKKIFRIFQRLHESEKYEGNGVGLAMCHRIMTRHGGKIEANSSPDHGAEFILYFPKHSDGD